MPSTSIAKAETEIRATAGEVWEALVTPEAIKQYMFGADVESDWEEGSPITWTGEMRGKRYEDRGVVLTVVPEHTLEYIHFSPPSAKPSVHPSFHTVTIKLTEEGAKTSVSLSQDNNATESARKESTKNWTKMLRGLKKYLEH